MEKMFAEIQSEEAFNRLIEEKEGVLAYFSTDTCNVCKVLKPKVADLVQEAFPELETVYVRSDVFPEVAGQHRVFAAPTILVFFGGRETIRKSRNIGLGELRKEIQRPYSMVFS